MFKEIVNKLSKLFHSNKKNFIIYFFVGGFISLLNIFLMWLFIDIFRIKTVTSGAIVVGGLFILKFILYKKTGFAR